MHPEPRVPKKFRDWANKWATRFGIDRAWDMHYKVEEITVRDDAVAATAWTTGYQNATIFISPTLVHTRDLPDTAKEHALIHEHLHILFARLSDAVEKKGSKRAYQAYCEQEELLLDQLASLFQRAYSRKTRVI